MHKSINVDWTFAELEKKNINYKRLNKNDTFGSYMSLSLYCYVNDCYLFEDQSENNHCFIFSNDRLDKNYRFYQLIY